MFRHYYWSHWEHKLPDDLVFCVACIKNDKDSSCYNHHREEFWNNACADNEPSCLEFAKKEEEMTNSLSGSTYVARLGACSGKVWERACVLTHQGDNVGTSCGSWHALTRGSWIQRGDLNGTSCASIAEPARLLP